jgi:hypothetical protein
LRADAIRGILAARIVYLPVYLKTLRLKYTKYNFPVVLYGCETWPRTLREERILRVSENRMLRRIFGSKMDAMTVGWRKLYNEKLHILYSSSIIIRMII